MYDPRVFRGSTTGIPTRASGGRGRGGRGNSEARTAESAAKVRAQSTSAGSGQILRRPKLETTSEIHASIRVVKTHEPVPLHLYLEEQAEPIKVSTESTQTDAFLPAEPEAPYIPPKMGFDVGTQVQTEDIFNFDREAEPLLDEIVMKTIDQALVEVRQEEELKRIRSRIAHIHVLEAKHDNLRKTLETQELERYHKQQAAVLRAAEINATAAALKQRVIAEKISGKYLDLLCDRVVDKCMQSYREPTEIECEEYVTTDLHSSVMRELQHYDAALEAARQMVYDAIAKTDSGVETPEATDTASTEIQQPPSSDQPINETVLYVHTADNDVGPLHLAHDLNIAQVEQQVREMCQVPDNKSIVFRAGESTETLPPDLRLEDMDDQSLSQLTMEFVPAVQSSEDVQQPSETQLEEQDQEEQETPEQESVQEEMTQEQTLPENDDAIQDTLDE
jgi:Radial spoke protein 3